MTQLVRWTTTMSLDGFIAGPDDDMDWVFTVDVRPPEAQEVMETLGAAVTGRRGWDVGRERGWELFGGDWQGPLFVVSHRRRDVGDDRPATFCPDIESAVEQALSAAAGKHVLILGAQTARSAFEAGLIDEVLVHLLPVLLGGGVRLFDRPQGGPPIELETLQIGSTGPVATLRYRFKQREVSEPCSI
ncbi:MAG: dihydrofolate reductase family protein [Candidatus Dormibacteraceae bacterium]